MWGTLTALHDLIIVFQRFRTMVGVIPVDRRDPSVPRARTWSGDELREHGFVPSSRARTMHGVDLGAAGCKEGHGNDRQCIEEPRGGCLQSWDRW